MNRNRTSRTAQSGFSLIELLVGLALLTLLAVAISGSFDGSRSRAQSLLSMMSELGSAQARLKNDTGCYAMEPLSLSDRAKGTSSVNFCGKTPKETWNGPYVNRFTATAAGNVAADKVSTGTELSFVRIGTTLNGVAVKRYIIRAIDVPADVAKQFLQECNGKADPAATYDAGQKCIATNLDTELSIVEMLWDETR